MNGNGFERFWRSSRNQASRVSKFFARHSFCGTFLW